MVKTLEKASPEEEEKLTNWLTRKEFDPVEKIQAVTDIFDKLHIKELTNVRIKDYYKAALDSLEHLDRPPEKKTELFNFASYLMNRQK